jgi:hypothetical protein
LLEGSTEYSRLVESITSHKFYEFVWIDQDSGSGAFLPHSVNIQVNTQTGQVDSYTRYQESVTVSTQPNISEQQAEDNALDAIEAYLSNAAITQTYLVVVSLPLYEKDTTQYLAWHLIIKGEEAESGYIPEFDIFIDAHTGELVALELRT